MLSSNSALRRLWNLAAEIDRTLQIRRHDPPKLRQKYVPPQRYSRHKMFLNMARRRVGIFSGVPVSVLESECRDPIGLLTEALRTKIPSRARCRVQVGPSHTVTYLPIREVARRWLGKRAIVGVTDLHIRGTQLERIIDTRELSFFNTLIHGSDELACEETLSMVIASPGNVTDSHSDDHDGTNHCFTGKKLWLTWDALEGMKAGLEDVERQVVYSQAKFEMSTFLALNSARWFVISSGHTLFLPGNLTHKVVTLSPYLGVGNFYVSLPSSLHSLSRWLANGALWAPVKETRVKSGLVSQVAQINLRIANRARSASRKTRDRWGYAYMRVAYDAWKRSVNPAVQDDVMQDEHFRALVAIARSSKMPRPQ